MRQGRFRALGPDNYFCDRRVCHSRYEGVGRNSVLRRPAGRIGRIRGARHRARIRATRRLSIPPYGLPRAFGPLWRNDHTRRNCVVDVVHGLIRPRSRPYGGSNWALVGGTDWGCDMSSISCASTSCVDVKANRIRLDASLVSAGRVRNVIQLFAVALGGALLGACAQSTVVTRNSEFVAGGRQASLQHDRTTSFVTNRRVAFAKKHTPFAPRKNAAETQIASGGVASFYTEGTRTASGEKFDTHELTAAHPTLPFGTRLRVTNVATGQSVTVRVNDRGPYVPGRSVDVSYSAADALGMVGRGIAKVRLDVVQ